MPKSIVNRRKPSPTPPCGRKIDYVVPHSPFQKLVDGKLKATPSQKFPHRPMSYQECSELIGLHKSVLWAWTHCTNGYPHPKSCTPARLGKLSTLLEIPLPRLQEALDASRHLYTQREKSTPTAVNDALQSLISILENDKRTVITRSYVLNLAKRLYAGAKASS